MKRKNIIFGSFYMVGGLVVMALGFNFYSGNIAATLALSWFLIFGVGQFFIFRCPKCRKLAIIMPGGISTPFVGNHCRYCGSEY
jgi:hypothetical protein